MRVLTAKNANISFNSYLCNQTSFRRLRALV